MQDRIDYISLHLRDVPLDKAQAILEALEKYFVQTGDMTNFSAVRLWRQKNSPPRGYPNGRVD